jgi:hypothetical protein
MVHFPDFMYENTRRVGYPLGEGEGTAYFVPVCPNCGRYVKMDHEIFWNEENGLKDQPNATCKKDGRVKVECELVD